MTGQSKVAQFLPQKLSASRVAGSPVTFRVVFEGHYVVDRLVTELIKFQFEIDPTMVSCKLNSFKLILPLLLGDNDSGFAVLRSLSERLFTVGSKKIRLSSCLSHETCILN